MGKGWSERQDRRQLSSHASDRKAGFQAWRGRKYTEVQEKRVKESWLIQKKKQGVESEK